MTLKDRIAAFNHGIEVWTARKFSFDTDNRLRFYERLAGYMKDGIALDSAVAIVHKRWVKKKKGLRALTASLLAGFREGKRFAETLMDGEWSPSQEVVLIDAGERAGNLPQGLEQAIYVTSSLQKLRSSIAKGLAYPAFLMIALIGLFVFYGIKTVPEMVKVIPLDQWPPSTLPFYYLTTGLVAYGPYLLAAALVIGVLIVWSLPRWTGAIRAHADVLPPWSIYRIVQGSSMLIAVGGLLTTGTPLFETLTIIEGNSSTWLRTHIAAIKVRLRRGLPAGEAMDVHLFKFSEVGDDLADYGRLSNFEDAVVTLGKRTIERVLDSVQQMTAVINILLILVIAGSVMWMYVSFMSVADSATQSFH